MHDVLSSRLENILQQFPKEKELSLFYLKLLRLTLDYVKYKKSLGAVHWAQGKIHELRRYYQSKLQKAATLPDLQQHSHGYYGRVASIIKQIKENLLYLQRCRAVMRTYPDIKEMCTACIYGFPNVGKTTLLNALAGSKAKVAAYVFTTTSINAGYLTIAGQKIQLLDVPGTLARPAKANLIELQAELVLQELATVVIFVFDFSPYSTVSLQKQEQLYEKVKAMKPVLIYVSKQDVTPVEKLQEFSRKHFTIEELRTELGKCCVDKT